MKIACLMMQKNEGPLLQSWIDYHVELFGPHNIFIYDNGSTDTVTKEVLSSAQKSGVNVEYEFSTRKHFEDKGNIFTAKIHELEATGDYDFFFPLDGDEFLAVEIDEGVLSVEPEVVKSSLTAYLESPDVLMISSEYNNNPMARDYYKRRDIQRKCFFAKNACASLDMGYHNGKAKSSELEVKTPVVYLHFHNKTYDNYQRSAREKMIGRVKDFSEETLRAHLAERKIGFHVIPALLKSREEYEAGFDIGGHVYFPGLRDAVLKSGYSEFFDGFSLRPAKGFIESAVKTTNGIELKGWAVSDSGDRVDSLKVIMDGSKLTGLKIEYVSRRDVVKTGIAKSEGCGFHIVIHEKSCDIARLKVVAVVSGEERLVRRG
ncbi:glycosyltransferase family 2 protein [Pseudomonas juntendi]|uniref:glycosyltransferase family 2 protein n=1 Tax=Pseudomonas juntendi TaxID=2666183 RepID=UPI0021B28394|nr:glycosyltransferase family 2 protein [Pseudomonas juntendi]UXA36940.1 glycosyltransferase family 2 protein [Pseudomonas juntendi]